ncbi:MAG: hypothetical protein AAGD07_19285 [Planctomycetota bacterium]
MMLALLKHLKQSWEDWCGDKEMELAIRRHLSQHGYFGKTARLRAVRLVAVQRPGWLQVFRFESRARLDPGSDDEVQLEPQYHDLHGLVRIDRRKEVTDVRVFQRSDERLNLFARWSEGLICLRGAQGLVTSDKGVEDRLASDSTDR